MKDITLSKPLVTLITPAYNAAPWLKRYLDSVISQTWRPLQFVISNDGSTDATADILRDYDRCMNESNILYTVLDLPHQGQSWAVNAALLKVRGDFLTWCDADDELDPLSIQKKAEYLVSHPEHRMVRTNGRVVDDSGNFISYAAREKERRPDRIFDAVIRDLTYCYAGCYMYSTAFFRECYPDMQIPNSAEGQNMQLLLPMCSRTVCGYIDEALHTYHQHSGSHSSKPRSYSELLVRLKNFTELKHSLLPLCECSQNTYEQIIHEIEEKRRIELIHSAVLKLHKERRRAAKSNKETTPPEV